ncbi:MAG: leucine-rich repeat domain-containing protein [Clostridium sp.]|nr:leucine-rich repeat domain-containing protein [Clostridium sp.]
MKKRRLRKAAIFLVFCMVFSVFSGIPVSATEIDDGNEPGVTGLVVTDNDNLIRDNDWKPTGVIKDAQYSQKAYSDLYGTDVYLGYRADEASQPKAVGIDEISVTYDGGNAGADGTAQWYEYETGTGLFHFNFYAVGDYIISYEKDGETSSITIEVNWPDVGFYTSEEKSVDTLIKDISYTEGEKNTFYMILHRNPYSRLDLDNITYTKDENDITGDISSYFYIAPQGTYNTSSEMVSDWDDENEVDYVYEVKVKENLTESFWLNVKVPKQDVKGEEGDRYLTEKYFPERGIGINYQEKMDGLVVTTDFDWNDDGPVGVAENAYYAKENGSDLYGNWFYFGYKENEEDKELDAVGEEKISVKDAEGNNAGGENGTAQWHEHKEEKGAGIYYFNFKETGMYTVSYTDENGKESSVRIYVGYPEVGFYTSAEKSESTLLREDEISYAYGEEKTFYMILHRNARTKLCLEDMDCKVVTWTEDGEERSDAMSEDCPYLTVTPKTVDYDSSNEVTYYDNDTEEDYVYEVKVKKGITESFGLDVQMPRQEVVDEESDEESQRVLKDRGSAGRYIDIRYEAPPLIEDGLEHTGFAGCFISKEAYDNNSSYEERPTQAQYWVHADTLQDVIDKLMETAKKGSVEVDGDTYSIENTGYIWANVSYLPKYEENAQAAQYMTTPSDVEGVIISSGFENYYTTNQNNVGTNYKVYLWHKDGEDVYTCVKDEETATLANPDDRGTWVHYPVTRNDDTFTITSDGEAQTANAMRDKGYELDNEDGYGIYCEWPELHVDATTNVKILGNFREAAEDRYNVYLGLYKDSDITSRIMEFKQVVDENGAPVTDEWGEVWEWTTSAEITTDNLESGKGEIVIEDRGITVKVTEMGATMGATVVGDFIDSDDITIEEEGQALRDKIDIEGIIAEDEDLKKALIDGETLDVSLDIKEVGEDPQDTDVQTGVEKISALLNPIKNFTSKIQYLDIGLNYKVGNVTSGSITETKEDINISIKLPEDFAKAEKKSAKSWKPVVYRYHDGKAERLDCTWKDGKLTFQTGKFSVYAVAIEEVVPTGIKITKAPTKTAYTVGEKFDKTGMEVEVTYSDESKGKITDYTVPTTALAKTDTEITVTYDADGTKYTAKQAVTVKEAAATTETTETPQTPADTIKAGEPVTVDGNNYKVSSVENGKKAVTYTSGDKNAKKVVIPATVKINGEEYKVTTIANGAFSGSKKLTTVTIGKNVTSIEDKAFYKCTALKKVTIPANVTKIGKQAFSGCKKLATVTIGKNVTSIGDKAFYQCTALKKITIPAKVNKIGKQAFYGCKNLKTITIKTSKLTNKNVGSKAFKGIASKATIKVPKKKLASYKKILKSKGVGSKAKIKK